MADVCNVAGLDGSQFVTEEGALVQCGMPVVSLVVGDAFIFERLGFADFVGASVSPMVDLDRIWTKRGILSNLAKAFDRQSSITVLGVDLVDGFSLRIRMPRLLQLFAGAVDLLRIKRARGDEIVTLNGWMS